MSSNINNTQEAQISYKFLRFNECITALFTGICYLIKGGLESDTNKIKEIEDLAQDAFNECQYTYTLLYKEDSRRWSEVSSDELNGFLNGAAKDAKDLFEDVFGKGSTKQLNKCFEYFKDVTNNCVKHVCGDKAKDGLKKIEEGINNILESNATQLKAQADKIHKATILNELAKTKETPNEQKEQVIKKNVKTEKNPEFWNDIRNKNKKI